MVNGSDKSIDGVFEDMVRPTAAAGAIHVNNNRKGVAMIFFFGGLLLAGGWMFMLAKYATAPNGGYVSHITPSYVVPSVIPVTNQAPPVIISNMSRVAGQVAVVSVLVTSVPSQTLEPTIIPSLTPTFTPTLSLDVRLIVKSFWPKNGWANAKMVSGLSPASASGASACPDIFPLGTVFTLLDSRRKLTCLDRAGLGCDGGICSVIVYTPNPVLDGVQPAQIDNPPKTWPTMVKGK